MRKTTKILALELEKAFDLLWQEGLVHKLQQNIPVGPVKLKKSYFSNRKFRVRIQDKTSTSRNIKAGVPQGGGHCVPYCSCIILARFC